MALSLIVAPCLGLGWWIMLRFYTSDLTHDITIPASYEPPRPTIRPRERVTSLAPLLNPPDGDFIPEWMYDGGIRMTKPVRFVSSESQGFVTYALLEAFLALYESGGAFLVDTDLLGPPDPDDEVLTFNALWEPGSAPEFSPAANGQLWYFDLSIRVKEVEAA